VSCARHDLIVIVRGLWRLPYLHRIASPMPTLICSLIEYFSTAEQRMASVPCPHLLAVKMCAMVSFARLPSSA